MKEIPKKIGIIMDGNGRWAKQKNLPRSEGHRAGLEALKKIVKACPDLGITSLTIYAFAIANWSRDESEISYLWNLARFFFKENARRLVKAGVCIRVLGDRSGLPKDIVRLIEKIEKDSARNSKLFLYVALNYCGSNDVERAVKKIAERVQFGDLSSEKIDLSVIRAHMDTANMPNPDVIIRTGLDENIGRSNFMLNRGSGFLTLESEQTELIAVNEYWPDMTPELLAEALQSVRLEDRLFGGQRPEVVQQ